MACTTFNITNDQIDEVEESFEISFTAPAGIIPPSTNPMVTIIDDESELIVFSILFKDHINTTDNNNIIIIYRDQCSVVGFTTKCLYLLSQIFLSFFSN